MRAQVWVAVATAITGMIGAGHTSRADTIAAGASKTTVVKSKAADTLKESTMTMKVKARLATRRIVTLATIHVSDKDGIIWLSGTAPTADASALAGEIARDTDGVVAVHNAIVVQ